MESMGLMVVDMSIVDLKFCTYRVFRYQLLTDMHLVPHGNV